MPPTVRPSGGIQPCQPGHQRLERVEAQRVKKKGLRDVGEAINGKTELNRIYIYIYIHSIHIHIYIYTDEYVYIIHMYTDYIYMYVYIYTYI